MVGCSLRKQQGKTPLGWYLNRSFFFLSSLFPFITYLPAFFLLASPLLLPTPSLLLFPLLLLPHSHSPPTSTLLLSHRTVVTVQVRSFTSFTRHTKLLHFSVITNLLDSLFNRATDSLKAKPSIYSNNSSISDDF